MYEKGWRRQRLDLLISLVPVLQCVIKSDAQKKNKHLLCVPSWTLDSGEMYLVFLCLAGYPGALSSSCRIPWHSQVCSGSSPGSPPSLMCPEYLRREVFTRHPNQMPETTSKGSPQNKELGFLSELVADVSFSLPGWAQTPCGEKSFYPQCWWVKI